MKLKLQLISAFFFIFFIFSAFFNCEINATENGNSNISDSIINKNKNTQYLRYALLLDNSRKLNSIFLSPLYSKKIVKTSGYLLDDGTTWLYETDINNYKLALMTGVVLSVETIGYYRLKDLWYDWETTKIHSIDFVGDFNKYQWMDKFGHFMHAYFATGLFSKGYRWIGMNGENSVLYGALSGWLWMLQIEIADGFFEEWGFSWGDLIANTLGAGFSALQQVYPAELGGIQPKISYQVSKSYKEKLYYHEAKGIIDDYEGMTFWLAINAFHYMPKNIQENYPEWLKPFGLAVGHSAKGIAVSPVGGHREIFIGLDYDLRKLSLGNESSIIRFLKNELNIIRLPLPAVKISPDGVWYGLYF